VTTAGHTFLKHPEKRKSLRALTTANECFCRLYHRLEVIGKWQLPESGPAILVSNHISGLDPLLIQSVSPRIVVWLMAREYYEVKATKWVFRLAESIPVERTGRDLASTRAAMRALEAGRILGIFPEGKIEPSVELLPFQTGVALMAIKTGVPVYPAYLDGTARHKSMIQAMIIPNRLKLSFGPPVEFDRSSTGREGLERATEAIYQAVARLKRGSDRESR
jgi:1-acyl-sn-glycerol-3-phosphate acyltransferase